MEPLGEQHVAGLDDLAHDPDVQRNTYVPEPPPPGFGRTWLDAYVQGRSDGTREAFAIVDSVDGTFLGLAAAVHIDEAGAEAELGYIVAAEARGRGIATEALAQLTAWAFGRGLQRLELRIDTENTASQRVAERSGYTCEGVLRSIHFKNGRRTDLTVYSRLPGD